MSQNSSQMTRSEIWYLAAPVAPELPWESVEGNLEMALHYQRALLDIHVYTAMPWWTLVKILDDTDKDQRSLGQSIAIGQVRVYAGVVCCGPRWSSGMAAEATEATECGKWVVDLVGTDPRDYGRVWGKV